MAQHSSPAYIYRYKSSLRGRVHWFLLCASLKCATHTEEWYRPKHGDNLKSQPARHRSSHAPALFHFPGLRAALRLSEETLLISLAHSLCLPAEHHSYQHLLQKAFTNPRLGRCRDEGLAMYSHSCCSGSLSPFPLLINSSAKLDR